MFLKVRGSGGCLTLKGRIPGVHSAPLQGTPDIYGSIVPAGASDCAGPFHSSGFHQCPSLCLDTHF